MTGRRPLRTDQGRFPGRFECGRAAPARRVCDLVSLAEHVRHLPSVVPDPAFRRELRDRLLAEFQGHSGG